MIRLIYLIVLVVFLSCSKNSNPTGPSFSIPHLKDTLNLSGGDYSFMETPQIYDDKLIVMITNSDTKEGWINCYDKRSLELLWTWSEALEEFGAPAKGFGFISHVYDGILAISQSNLSYGIDINTGKTLWKNREANIAASTIIGYEEVIANFGIVDSRNHDYIKVANISTGSWRNIFDFIKDDSLNVALGSPYPFKWNNKTYVAFIKSKWGTSPHLEISWLNLYNLTDDRLEWTSDTIPLNHFLSGPPNVQPSFEDGQILLGNDAIYSYNVEDGSLEWWKWYGNSFITLNKLISADGIVYGNNDSQFFVGLDGHTGEEIFKTTTGGSTSKIAYHEGKCYMSSVTVGATNRIMVIDALTGEILRNELAPFRDEDKLWTFDRAIAVDPETGLVYTADHRSLLVYDFDL